MKLFDLFRRPDFGALLEQANLSQSPVIDVRTVMEYQQGHVPGSINIPRGFPRSIQNAVSLLPERRTQRQRLRAAHPKRISSHQYGRHPRISRTAGKVELL